MKNHLFAALAALVLGTSALLLGSATVSAQKPAPAKPKMAAVQKATVTVTESGYTPSTLNFKAGVPAQVTFVRKSDKTCGTEVLLPDYKIQKALPLNKPVVVAFTPKKAGTYTFTCGMKMFKGSVIVK
jgi:plastocyanin domain-containing protein